MSRRGAAERFGVSAAGAVRWVVAVNTTGSVEAKPQGGDTRSHQIEAFSAVILAAVTEQKDISLLELAELLRTEHGASFEVRDWAAGHRNRSARKDGSSKQFLPPSWPAPTGYRLARLLIADRSKMNAEERMFVSHLFA